MTDSDIKIFHNSCATLLWGIVFVAAAVFIASSISLIFRTYHGQSPIVREYPYFEDIDSIVSKEIAPYEELRPDYKLLHDIWRNQKHLNSQRDNILADVRQETNNSIEKISAELNFWVAIIAILGVLVPIALTFKGERESKEWLSKKEVFYDEKIRVLGDNLVQKVSFWEEKIEELKQGISKDLSKLESWQHNKDSQWDKSKTDLINWQECRTKELEIKFNEYSCRASELSRNVLSEWQSIKRESEINREETERMMQQLNLQMSTSSLASIRNNRFLETESQIKAAYNRMAHHTIKNYFSLFESLINNDKEFRNEDTKWNLIRMSMQFYEILHNLTLSHHEPVRPRFLYEGQNSVRHLIKNLMENFPCYDDIQSQLNIVKQRTEIILQNILA